MLGRWLRFSQSSWQALRARDDPQRILELQNRQLRLLVRYCYERVPFYRRLFRSVGLQPQEIRGLDDIHKIPLVGRADIQHLDASEVCAEGTKPEKLLMRRTSGSSGAPLTIRRRWEEERLIQALKLQVSFEIGLSARSRRLFISHRFPGESWKDSLYNAPLLNRLGVLPISYQDWRLPKSELIDRLAAFQPDVIVGAPSILSWIAEELGEQDRERIRPRLLFVGGELCVPEMMACIERGFGAPIAERYGSHEFVFLAIKPPGAQAYRVCGASVIVEVLDDGEPVAAGGTGEIVVTGLHSFAMPFVRYRLGDLVERGHDPGWHAHSVRSLSSIRGRVIERFILASGAVVHPYTVANMLRDGEPWLSRFQIIQTRRNRFLVRVVPFDDPSRETVERTARKLESVFPEPVEVAVEAVEELPPTQTGKFYPYVAIERYQLWGGRAEP